MDNQVTSKQSCDQFRGLTNLGIKGDAIRFEDGMWVMQYHVLLEEGDILQVYCHCCRRKYINIQN